MGTRAHKKIGENERMLAIVPATPEEGFFLSSLLRDMNKCVYSVFSSLDGVGGGNQES